MKGDLAKAVADQEAAEKAAREAEAQARSLPGVPASLRAHKKKAAEAAIARRQGANQAKTSGDKLVSEEKSAASRLAEANKKVEAAQATHQQQRVPALQDVLWSLLNTKEFMCNH